MLDRVNVFADLQTVICHRQSEGNIFDTGSEPYLWPLFFAIDGNGVAITNPPEFTLSGHATVLATQGGHSNLGDDGEVEGGTTIPIPSHIGEFRHESLAMALPHPCDPLKPEGVLGVVGVIVLLMEEDNVTDDGANAGYTGLRDAVQSALDEFLNGRSIFAGEPTQEELDEMAEDVEAAVTDAIVAQQNFFENIWAGIDKDDKLVQKIWVFSVSDLVDQVSVPLQVRQTEGGEDDWEINGRIVASRPCIFESSERAMRASSGHSMDGDAFRQFRDFHLRERPYLGSWLELANRNSPAIAHLVMTNPRASERVRKVVDAMGKRLGELDSKIDGDVYGPLEELLKLAMVDSPSHARRDFNRLRSMVRRLEGKTIKEAIDLLSRTGPPYAGLARSSKFSPNPQRAKRP